MTPFEGKKRKNQKKCLDLASNKNNKKESEEAAGLQRFQMVVTKNLQ